MRATRALVLGGALLGGALVATPRDATGALVGASRDATGVLAERAAMPPGHEIRVRGVAGDTVVSLLPTPGGGLVRADVLARLLGGRLDSAGIGRWDLTLYATTIELRAGIPFATYHGYPLPLSEATRVVGGHPHVSLQLFSEIIPRFGIGILWDRERAEVRLFQAIASRAGPASLPRRDEAESVVARASRTVTPDRDATGATSRPRTATTAAPAKPAPEPGAPKGLLRKYKVVVDAGHGGRDPGNPGRVVDGRRMREAGLTLSISLRLEKELKRRGFDVFMTRRTDTLIGLHDRGPLANQQGGDMFVSIHTNAADPKWRNATGVRGFETYFLAEAQSEDERRVEAMENSAVRFESSVETEKGDPLSFLIADIAQNEHLRESSDLAAVVQQRLGVSHPGPNRGVKQANLAVLRDAFMPAVLVEVGYGSNLAEVSWLSSAAGQQATVVALADAITEYFRHYERRVQPSQR